jgi:hypothetical protein
MKKYTFNKSPQPAVSSLSWTVALLFKFPFHQAMILGKEFIHCIIHFNPNFQGSTAVGLDLQSQNPLCRKVSKGV